MTEAHQASTPVEALKDTLVIDSVLRSYNLTPENQGGSSIAATLTTYFYAIHGHLQPPGETKYLLDSEKFHFGLDQEWLARAVRGKSD